MTALRLAGGQSEAFLPGKPGREPRRNVVHFAPPSAALQRLLARPDLAAVAEGCAIATDPDCPCFRAGADGVRLPPGGFDDQAAVALRHAIEIAVMRRAGAAPALAGLGAARVAARFAGFERLLQASEPAPDAGIAALAGAAPPSAAALVTLWRRLAVHQPDADPTLPTGTVARLAALWPLLEPVEALLQSGGDARLRVDPRSGLNGYGSSHRPRPWAVTFASSTASSTSERGFAAAEQARRRWLSAGLARGTAPVLAEAAAAVKAAIAAHYGLPAGTEVLLAASGTDCELFTLALAQLHPSGRPLVNILVAPEETGSGVPLAAEGRHFAADTAWGVPVAKGARVAGFDPRVRVARVAVRAGGRVRSAEAVAADCAAIVGSAVASGIRAVLHLLDQSKTGLIAPAGDAVRALHARHPDALDVVVDACQARVAECRVRAWLAAGWMVQLTGSKFFTGPPFAGTVLVPPSLAGRLDRPLPAGLADYAGRHEWPPRSRAAGPLTERANLGLLLRWEATLAEMRVFAAVDPAWRCTVLERFGAAVRAAVAASPDLRLLPPPVPARAFPEWDALPTIFSFAVLFERRPMDPAEARQVYRWLNSDLRTALPDAEPALAGLRCHIGQPAPVAEAGGAVAGVLRISAGARLVSGEPSHAGLDREQRLDREIADMGAAIAKIGLIVRHYARLQRADPGPTFR